jgi:multiple sugar transport system ATP-binding protein
MSSLALNNVNKYYGPHLCVLKDINIEVESGEFLVMLGPSGCGKSTLLHAIAGLHGISSGQIKLDGRVINDVPCQHRDIAMVFQSYALYPSMTVRQNIAFPLQMKKATTSVQNESIEKVAKLLQIEHLLGRKPSQLSGGASASPSVEPWFGSRAFSFLTSRSRTSMLSCASRCGLSSRNSTSAWVRRRST